MVQEPSEALSASMPRATISAVGEPETILPAAKLGSYLAGIVTEEVGPAQEVDPNIRMELMISGLERASMRNEEKLGELSPYNCPDCNGVLWEIKDGPLTRFRCHTGHAYSSASLHHQQEQMLERSLFDSLRACRERAKFVSVLAERDPSNAARWKGKADSYEEDCALLEQLIQTRQAEKTDE